MTTSQTDAAAQDDALGGTRMPLPPESLRLPLKFTKHDFEAHCYGTLACSVIYADDELTRPHRNAPSPAKKPADFEEAWGTASYVGIRNFPDAAQVRWTSLDGSKHETAVDIGKIFENQLAWHLVPMSDYAQGSFGDSVDVFLEVNDRTINIYTKAFIGTLIEQIPGNEHSTGRNDLLLAWTRTY